MKQNILLKLRTTQTDGEATEETELSTEGTIEEQDGEFHIRYEESEATGFDGCVTEITVCKNEWVSIIRTGEFHQDLMLEVGKKHHSIYHTPFGEAKIGVFAHKIENHLKEAGGTLYFKYTLDVDAAYLSDNEIDIEVLPL